MEASSIFLEKSKKIRQALLSQSSSLGVVSYSLEGQFLAQSSQFIVYSGYSDQIMFMILS